MGKPLPPDTPENYCGTRSTIQPAELRGGGNRGGGWLLGGHAGAFDGPLWRAWLPKRPISRPRPRAGVIWLETDGAGESYTSVSLMRAGEAGADRRIREMAIG